MLTFMQKKKVSQLINKVGTNRLICLIRLSDMMLPYNRHNIKCTTFIGFWLII